MMFTPHIPRFERIHPRKWVLCVCPGNYIISLPCFSISCYNVSIKVEKVKMNENWSCAVNNNDVNNAADNEQGRAVQRWTPVY